MGDRYEQFRALEKERAMKVRVGSECGRLLGEVLLDYCNRSVLGRLFEKDPPESWSDEWVQNELIRFIRFLNQETTTSLQGFGKGDFPTRKYLPSNQELDEA